MGEFVNPRTNPACGVKIERAEEEVHKDISKIKKGSAGSALLGNVLGAETGIVLSARDIVSQHVSVIASTGSGKSYTAGVLVEELLKPYNMAPVLIFDPHGEYSSLGKFQNMPDFISIMDDGTIADSLSQCMTQITMRIINPTDQQQIAQSIESASRDLISELPSFAKGQAIISGVAINTPTLVRIRKRLTSDVRGRSKDK